MSVVFIGKTVLFAILDFFIGLIACGFITMWLKLENEVLMSLFLYVLPCVYVAIKTYNRVVREKNKSRILFKWQYIGIKRKDYTYKLPLFHKDRKELAHALRSNMSNSMSLIYNGTDLNLLDYYIKRLEDNEKEYRPYKRYEKGWMPNVKGVTDNYANIMEDTVTRNYREAVYASTDLWSDDKEMRQKYYDGFCEQVTYLRENGYYALAEQAEELAEDLKKYVDDPTGKRENLPSFTNLIDQVDVMEGHEFEYWCADLLRKNGYENVEVTRGSGDQGIDVLAEFHGITYAIQCKCYTSDLGNKPVQEAFTGKQIYKRDVAVVMTNRYFTAGAREAADATGVKLWDRSKLAELLGNVSE